MYYPFQIYPKQNPRPLFLIAYYNFDSYFNVTKVRWKLPSVQINQARNTI